MSFHEYGKFDALGLAQAIAKKKVSTHEVMDEAIARAEALNTKLNAIIFKAYDEARSAARTKTQKGPFAGVPMLLKDMRANVRGWPNRSGSRYVPAAPSTFESTLVTRCKAVGLIPLGKTNVPEFGILPTTECKLYGPATIRGTSHTRRVARRAVPLLRSPPGSFRSRMRPMAAARSAFPPRPADW